MDNISTKPIIKRIIEEKIPCIFVSPHLDDAILSAGDLISYLSDKTQVEVVNVFTKAEPRPYSLSTRAFLGQCGYTDADKLFEDRIAEDKEVFSRLNIKPHYLGYVDAGWRKIEHPNSVERFLGKFIAEFGMVYPIYRLHVSNGHVSKNDRPLIERLTTDLMRIRDNIESNEVYIFCPLGAESHVDHLVVRKACKKAFKSNTIYWSDFPYNIRHKTNWEVADTMQLTVFGWQHDSEFKKELIKGYKSQFKALFPNEEIPVIAEMFCFNNVKVKPMKKLSITIGIPAFNEQDNIKPLLEAILSQKDSTFELKKIIVVSDASTDLTTKEVLSVKDPRIVLVDKKEREGAYKAQNSIIQLADEDILVLLNADVMPSNELYIENLIKPIINDPAVGLVCGQTVTTKPRTFSEKILANAHEMKKDIYMQVHKGNNLYMCVGVARAFSKSLYKSIKWPEDVPEDAYSYFACLRNGYKFIYAKDALLIFRTPSSMRDHVKQSTRFFGGQEKMEKYYKDEMVIQEYKIPLTIYAKSILRYGFWHPIPTVSYIITALYIKYLMPGKIYQAKWKIAESTKKAISPADIYNG